ncbi:MAG: hypothetical protein NVSMB22_17360 [Chloroflexota bacterium]
MLSEISRVVSSNLDLRALYATIYEQVGRVMDTTQFFIALHRPERNVIDVPYLQEEGKLFLDQEVPFGAGVTSMVIERGTGVLFRTDDEYAHLAEANRLAAPLVGDKESSSGIFVPMNTGNRTIGALTVQSNRSHAYTEDDVQTLSVIASQAAVAIENARLFSEQQRRVVELQVIQTIVQRITPLHDFPAIAAVINQELKQLIDYHACRVFLLDEHHNMLVPLAFDGADRNEIRLKVGTGLAGWIAQFGRSDIVNDSLTDTRGTQIPRTPLRAESIVGTPLSYRGRVRGVITLSKLGVNQFDQNDLRLLEIVATQAAIAFDRSRLYDELRTQAVTDELTKIYNRRYLLERHGEERSRAIRNGHSLVAMMLDLDNFKGINDTYGHDAGDIVLCEIAQLIRAAVRAEDIVSRYGGEEFCILLPEISLDDAMSVAERMRTVIDRHQWPEAAGVQRITVSIGLATLRLDDVEGEIFSRADQAMYAVKHRGGNRVCVDDDERHRFVGDDTVLAAVTHITPSD